MIFPVVAPPRVNEFIFKACKEPLPFKTSPVVLFPFCAEILAMGDVVFTPVKANLAAVVDTPPSRKS